MKNIKIVTVNSIKNVIFARMFFLLNRHKFKKLELNSLVCSPLRIDGSEYISIHKNVKINKFSWLFAAKIDNFEPNLIINEGCSIGDFNHIAAVRKVVLEKNVLTANRVYISDNLHAYADISIPIMHQKVEFKGEVSIGEGSWIGENACIIGAKIGKHCVIGANAVVTKDIEDFSVAVGVPAKVIKRYDQLSGAWVKVND